MHLKSLLIGAGALSALAVAAWAGDDHPTEVRREIIVEQGGPDGGHGGHHCHMMMMKMAGGDAMKEMAEHHGTITRDEFLAMHGKLFDHLDLNHDGKLEPDEIEKAHAMMESHDGDCDGMMHQEHMEMHGNMHGDDMHGDDMHGDMHGDAGEGDRHMEIRMVHSGHDFGAMDSNKDGRISFEEFAAPLREAFDQLDKNHDGYIDKAEWESHGHMEIRKELHDGEK
jgi:hypothetical protein